MKYTVQTRYEDFTFDNGDTAMKVAELMAEHSTENISIKITIEKEAEEDER